MGETAPSVQGAALHACCPEWLWAAILDVASSQRVALYLGGGALRDLMHGEVPHDLDFTVEAGAIDFLAHLRKVSRAGTLVALGEPRDDSGRLVFSNVCIDVTGFRMGAVSIEEDLRRRDFTINALAVQVDELPVDERDLPLIDPLGGLADLRQGLIRACPDAFLDDPLRLLRAYRFMARFGFAIEPGTRLKIRDLAYLVNLSAAERISSELDAIMLSGRAYAVLTDMASAGLLHEILPELSLGQGVSQPSFHHLDVLQHNLEALACIERIMADPDHFFQRCAQPVVRYLDAQANRLVLVWSALLHDLGKPLVRRVSAEQKGRITFYNHDGEGAAMARAPAERLRWSTRMRTRVVNLISMHMYPFHLVNVRRKDGRLSTRAMVKFCRRTGEELAGLFILAMADSLAGRGPDKPEGIEAELVDLFCRLERLYHEVMRPIVTGPKLLTGHDLIATLGLTPGPLFKEVLEAVETAVITGEITSRREALAWARRYLETDDKGKAESEGRIGPKSDSSCDSAGNGIKSA